MTRIFLFMLLFTAAFTSCVRIPKQYNILAPGIWRGTLVLRDTREVIVTRSIDKVVSRDVNPESTKTVIPFNFEIVYTSDSVFHMEVINGTERIRFDSIVHGRDARTGNDTMVVLLLPYAAELKFIFENNKMDGEFIVLDKVNYSIPFQASYGQNFRFVKLPEKTSRNISGNWNAVFARDSSDEFNAVGEFTQEGNKVTGTFRTETGDFRFLSGEISGDRMSLSAFDGAHAFLFTAEVTDTMMQGIFYSGKHYSCNWEARPSASDPLIHADSMSRIISDKPLELDLETPEGKRVSLNEAPYAGKAKVIQVTGSWCPNCRDESEFIREYLKKHDDDDPVFLAVAFERGQDRNAAMQRIGNYRSTLGLPYEIVLGGTAKRDSASALFPQTQGIKAFPTMLFLDRSNRIIRMHTGFDGPATSRFGDFVKYFEESISIIKQSHE